ncbi:metallophosphoesterase family protein [Streptomyces sp. NPDC057950]|uniref:metallophosphoesterase family protein n=1 Tax=Streptomyces sp. NPDC057950 TaxID=3346288 RepID=UPI0036EB9683
MGLRFDLATSNVVAHLLDPDRRPPRLQRSEISYFLHVMQHREDRFISSSAELAEEVRDRAVASAQRLRGLPDRSDVLAGPDVRHVLRPLEELFGRYEAVVLPVGTSEHEDRLSRFAQEAAHAPGHGLLVLMPQLYMPKVNVLVLDPDDGVNDAVKRSDEWPGAVFAVRGESSFFVPFDAAYAAVARAASADADLRSVLHAAREGAELQTATARRSHRRLLHLSDLHLGTLQTGRRREYLSRALSRLDPLDRVVITGDLFDQPRARHREQYEEFVHQLRDLTRAEPVVVPGNHDQRIFGNKVGRVGSRRGELAEVRWDRGAVHDRDAKLVFLCFNSSKKGDAARGGIGDKQLLDVATSYDAARRVAGYDDCLRIAVLHHHPYPYPLPDEEPRPGHHPSEDPVSGHKQTWMKRVWSRLPRERLLEMEDARQFLNWCAARDVSLVLHGHRHRSRLVTDTIPVSGVPFRRHELTTVGCGTSLGANDSPLSFNVIDWNPATGGWAVDFQESEPDGRGFRSVAVRAGTARNTDGR